MQYFAAYRFAFESPQWARNLLIGALCQLVPIAGPLVVMGYVYTIIEEKHRHGPGQFPEFDFDLLSTYLVRGVWPFLASLIAALPVVLIAMPVFLGLVFLGISTGQSDDPPWLMVGLIIVSIVAFALLSMVAHFLALPMILRAGLSQDLGSSLSLTFVWDFLRRVWKEMILCFLFVVVTAPFLMLAGFLMLIIGIYAAVVVMTFAQFHFHYQLYELYLRRGGTPIPLKEVG